MIPPTPCPECHLAELLTGYDPGATWAECPHCGFKTAVPDYDPEGLALNIKENDKPH